MKRSVTCMGSDRGGLMASTVENVIWFRTWIQRFAASSHVIRHISSIIRPDSPARLSVFISGIRSFNLDTHEPAGDAAV